MVDTSRYRANWIVVLLVYLSLYQLQPKEGMPHWNVSLIPTLFLLIAGSALGVIPWRRASRRWVAVPGHLWALGALFAMSSLLGLHFTLELNALNLLSWVLRGLESTLAAMVLCLGYARLGLSAGVLPLAVAATRIAGWQLAFPGVGTSSWMGIVQSVGLALAIAWAMVRYGPLGSLGFVLLANTSTWVRLGLDYDAHLMRAGTVFQTAFGAAFIALVIYQARSTLNDPWWDPPSSS